MSGDQEKLLEQMAGALLLARFTDEDGGVWCPACGEILGRTNQVTKVWRDYSHADGCPIDAALVAFRARGEANKPLS